MSDTVRINRIALVVAVFLVAVVLFVALMFIPDGSGTFSVRESGIVTYHFGGYYSIDSIKYSTTENKLINIPEFILWKTGELELTIVMSGPAHYSTTVSLGVIHDPIFDTTIEWSATFNKVHPGTYSVTFTLTENGQLKATRTVSQIITSEVN